MFVKWKKHSKVRFAERAAMLGINYGDIEFEVRKQKVKVELGNGKIKTIFIVGDFFITVIKIEDFERIYIITIWVCANCFVGFV